MNIDDWVEYAFEFNVCPCCSIRMDAQHVAGSRCPPDLIRNLWRHHIATLHEEDADA